MTFTKLQGIFHRAGRVLNEHVLHPLGLQLVRIQSCSASSLNLVGTQEKCHEVTDETNQAPVPTHVMRQITTLEELDAVLKECDMAQRISDDALRHIFSTFEFKIEALNLPDDPDSSEYREIQCSLYSRISGRDYQLANEASDWLKVQEAIAVPFPYYTKSFETVSNQLLALGLIIKMMRLPPGAKILEFGVGWGNTAVTLVRMGYHVTAIDIEPRFLEIISGRAAGFSENLTLIEGDFSVIADLPERYDAILFFESFHHCSDHKRLVAQFETRLEQDGIVVFAAEPIDEAFPMPWGLRLDGQSLWATRNFGWLELGFKESYFSKLMTQYGWQLEKFSNPITPLGTVFIAKRLSK